MNTRFLLTAVCAVVVVVFGAYYFVAPYAKEVEEQSYQREVVSDEVARDTGMPDVSLDTEAPAEALSVEKVAEVAVSEPKPAVTTEPKPVATTPTTPARSLYTTATVATHNSEASCWSIINDNVYDLTSFIPKHPGGERNILKICGKDGTSAFMGQHGGDTKPETTLAKHLLGKLSQ